MRKMLILAAILLIGIASVYAQTVYTFTGGGPNQNWSNANNWDGGNRPPDTVGVDTIIIINSVAVLNRRIAINPGATLLINSTLNMTSGSTGHNLFILGECIIGVNGTLNKFNASNIRIEGTLTNNGTFTRDNSLDIIRMGGKLINNGTLLNNSGTLRMANSGGVLENFGTIVNEAVVEVFDSLINRASGVITNAAAGAINLSGVGDLLDNYGALVNNGTILRNNGAITNRSGATLSGIGTVDMNSGTLVNDGTISPGNPGSALGTLTITGNLDNNGAIVLQITGTPGQSDVLAISGTAIFGGSTVQVSLLSGALDGGDAFTIVTYGSRIGDPTFSLPGVFADWTIAFGPPSLVITYNGAQILPIELISFTGQRRGEAIELNWRTGSEFNNDYMAVERSVNGIDFAEIGRVKGLGTTDGPADYRFTDAAPLRGVNYYRLRQVDFDGKTETHRTISAVFDGQVRLGLTVFPNPVFDQLQLRWGGEANATAELRLFDFQGRLLRRESLPAGLLTHELPVHTLTPGPYVLQIAQGNVLETVRFVKQ